MPRDVLNADAPPPTEDERRRAVFIPNGEVEKDDITRCLFSRLGGGYATPPSLKHLKQTYTNPMHISWTS